jgi:hypothetical protein
MVVAGVPGSGQICGVIPDFGRMMGSNLKIFSQRGSQVGWDIESFPWLVDQ